MSRRTAVVHSDDVTPEQASDIILTSTSEIDRAEVVAPLEASEQTSYMDELAFMEEPVTINIHPSQEENAPLSIPIWVNGRGAEILHEGKWIPATYIPVDREITIKRKYLESLARAKPTNIKTNVIEMPGQDPVNKIGRHTFMKYPFTLIDDKNPRGRAWLNKVLSER
jgi:hypothetical protein